MDSIQAEAGALLKRLNEAVKKVSNSVDDVKEQYENVLQVTSQSLRCLQRGIRPYSEGFGSSFPTHFFSAAGESGGLSGSKRKARRR